jgi:hypothetical protein
MLGDLGQTRAKPVAALVIVALSPYSQRYSRAHEG